MPQSTRLVLALVTAFALGSLPAPTRASGTARPPSQTRPGPDTAILAPVLWLEPAPAAGGPTEKTPAGEASPFLRPLADVDPRRIECERLVDNEAARLTRTLVAHAWKTFGLPHTWPSGALPILLKPGGNHAATGFRLLAPDGRTEVHEDVPFIILDLDAESLSDTFIHEGGHLLQSIAMQGRRPSPWWSAVLHSTFATTDPLTALAEGYAIHFETLRGHYGEDLQKRAYYHRLSPAFDLRNSRRAEFYAPVADLMTFSQSWARYQAVRENLAVFSGPVFPGEYLRSQYDPERDRELLKPANAMIASEGVVASVVFWTAVGLAERDGARAGGGLAQPGVVSAEKELLTAFSAVRAVPGEFRPDLIDLLSAVGRAGSASRGLALSRFVTVTRGVTARPSIRAQWTSLYRAALTLDFESTKPLFTALDLARDEIEMAARSEPTILRAGLGPILPVRAEAVSLQLKAVGETFPLEFDLNAAADAEWLAAGFADGTRRAKLLAERDRQPFASVQDFEQRTGVLLRDLGLAQVRRQQ